MFSRRDPVCKMKVNAGTPYVFRWQEKAYYFDSQACLDTFKECPRDFIKKKGWGRFLAWLAEGGKDIPKSCHECRKCR